jgi:hypothetical protein
MRRDTNTLVSTKDFAVIQVVAFESRRRLMNSHFPTVFPDNTDLPKFRYRVKG